jgi:hypothetical protein
LNFRGKRYASVTSACPEAHGRIENENNLMRAGLLALLSGKTTLKMDVTSFPVSEQDVAEQKVLREALQDLLDGKRALPVVPRELL